MFVLLGTLELFLFVFKAEFKGRSRKICVSFCQGFRRIPNRDHFQLNFQLKSFFWGGGGHPGSVNSSLKSE